MTDTNTVEPQGFAALGLDSSLVESLASNNYTTPTPIQAQAIPTVLSGRDLIGLAATGTGKTAAFSLPLVQRLAAMTRRTRPAALVIVPTRELAIQVAEAVTRYGQSFKISVLAVYGGTGFGDQARTLRRGVDVVVATPGRALDHIRRGTITLAGIQTVVLDEADEMLDMGFAEDIEAILTETPKERQTLLFSATMPPRIAGIAERHLTDPVRVTVARVQPVEGEAPKVRQVAYVVPPGYRQAALVRVIECEAPISAIVFCRTRTEAEEVTDALAERGHRPEALHGGLSQDQRDRVMRRFRDRTTTLLVATDVAARGLDISHLSHVINYHIPQATEAYVHRIGRVGRAGREGMAITILEPKERYRLRQIEQLTRQRIDITSVPTAKDLQTRRLERTRDALRALATQGGLEEYLAVIGPLANEFAPADLAAAAVALAVRSATPENDGPDIPPVAPPRERTSGDYPPRRGEPFRPGARRSPQANGNGSYAAATAGMTKVFVGAGRVEGVGRRELVAAFEDKVGIGSRELGHIAVGERFSLVEVPGEIADQAIDALQGVRFRGRAVAVRRDRRGPAAV